MEIRTKLGKMIFGRITEVRRKTAFKPLQELFCSELVLQGFCRKCGLLADGPTVLALLSPTLFCWWILGLSSSVVCQDFALRTASPRPCPGEVFYPDPICSGVLVKSGCCPNHFLWSRFCLGEIFLTDSAGHEFSLCATKPRACARVSQGGPVSKETAFVKVFIRN